MKLRKIHSLFDTQLKLIIFRGLELPEIILLDDLLMSRPYINMEVAKAGDKKNQNKPAILLMNQDEQSDEMKSRRRKIRANLRTNHNPVILYLVGLILKPTIKQFQI